MHRALLLTLALGCCTPRAPLEDPSQVVAGSCPRELASEPRDFPVLTRSPSYAGAEIAAIRVEGLARVSEQRVRRALRSRVGDAVDGERAREDLRALFALEVFSRISLSCQAAGGGKVTLVVSVVERSALESVQVYGFPANQISDRLRSGQPFEPLHVVRELEALRQRRVQEGHLEASYTYSSRAGRRGVELCLQGSAGPKYSISAIVFRGNQRVPDELLSSSIGDADRNRLGKRLDRAALSTDLRRVYELYYERGMLEARIAGPELTLDPERGAVSLRYSVDEGPVFRIGRLAVKGELQGDAADYAALFEVEPGDVFVRSNLLKAQDRMRHHHYARSGAHALISVDSQINRALHTVDLTFELEPAR